MDQVDGNCIGKIKNSENTSMGDNNANTREELEPLYNKFKTALMPIDQLETKYNMAHQSRGLLLIFNHQIFDKSTKQDERSGTDEDVKKITRCFDTLGFEIRPYQDLTIGELRECIRHCVSQDHNDNDCLAIFVLSHGDKDRLYAKDTWYNPAKEIWGNLTSDKCPSLAGKPKLVFLQACQGVELDPGITLVAGPSRTQFDGAVRSYKLPITADFLIVYATFEGYFAFRNTANGSSWVTILCEVLQANYLKLDILTMLTEVNRKLAVDFLSVNNRDRSKSGMKQIVIKPFEALLKPNMAYPGLSCILKYSPFSQLYVSYIKRDTNIEARILDTLYNCHALNFCSDRNYFKYDK